MDHTDVTELLDQKIVASRAIVSEAESVSKNLRLFKAELRLLVRSRDMLAGKAKPKGPGAPRKAKKAVAKPESAKPAELCSVCRRPPSAYGEAGLTACGHPDCDCKCHADCLPAHRARFHDPEAV